MGNYLPDAANSNQDATLTFAEHYDGTRWTVARTPNAGPDFNTLFGAAAADGRVWAVGVRQNGAFKDRALVEAWDGRQWSIADAPQPGSEGDLLTGASALSKDDVWVVGQQQGANGAFGTLAEHWDGHEWAAGESDTPQGGGQPLIVHYAPGHGWSAQHLPALPGGANWANLYGVAVAGGSVWAAGTYVDPVTDNNNSLVLRETGGHWATATVPAPGSGSNLPAGLTNIGGHLWMAGVYDDGGSRQPLIEHR